MLSEFWTGELHFDPLKVPIEPFALIVRMQRPLNCSKPPLDLPYSTHAFTSLCLCPFRLTLAPAPIVIGVDDAGTPIASAADSLFR
jgi:hypothetical protein